MLLVCPVFIGLCLNHMPFAENLDFLNANTLRNFPLREGVSKTDTTGAFVIPDDFMVDLILSVTSDPTRRVSISRIVNMPNEIEVEIVTYGSATVLGVFSIDVANHTRYQTYYLVPSLNATGATGKLVIGEVSTMLSMPYGTFSFTSANVEFETRTIIPGISTISRFVFENADGTSFTVSGDVTILAESNVRFRLINASTVAIDAGEGLGLNEDCTDVSPCIKTINSVKPDLTGNFWLTASECAKFTQISASTLNGLNLSETCCKPCLSCNEIGNLTERLMQLESDLLTLRNHYSQVSLVTQQFVSLSTASCECA